MATLQTALDRLQVGQGGDVGEELEPVSIATAAEAGWPSPSDPEATLEVRIPAELCAVADRDRFVQFFERVFDALLTDEAGPDGGATRPVSVTVGILDGGFFVESEGTDGSATPFDAPFTRGRGSDESRSDRGLRIASAVADAHGWQLSATDDGRRLEITDVDTV